MLPELFAQQAEQVLIVILAAGENHVPQPAFLLKAQVLMEFDASFR